MKGGGKRVVSRMEDTACLGYWGSGMSCGAKVNNRTIPGIGAEAG